MANALSLGSGPPPAPNPQPQEPTGGSSALAPGTPQGAGPPAPPPAPSHQQTVAALRHFSAVEQELQGLLSDPDIGKTDLKSKIQDGAVKLVAQGIMTAAEAVTQLSKVPEKPLDQKKWVEQHYVNAIQSASMVLDHHRAAFEGMPHQPPGNPDDHAAQIQGLMRHYGAPANG